MNNPINLVIQGGGAETSSAALSSGDAGEQGVDVGRSSGPLEIPGIMGNLNLNGGHWDI